MRSARPGSSPGVAASVAGERIREQLFEVGLERDDRQLGRHARDVLHDLATERDANLRLQLLRVLGAGRVLGERLDDRAHVLERHALGEQALQRAHDCAERQQSRREIFDELRRVLAERVEQLLHFFVAEQLVRVASARRGSGASRSPCSHRRR